MVSFNRPLYFSTFQPICKIFLKGPYVGRHLIKGCPGLKTGKKQNRGAAYLLILHIYGCKHIKIRLFLKSGFLKSLRMFWPHRLSLNSTTGPLELSLFVNKLQ